MPKRRKGSSHESDDDLALVSSSQKSLDTMDEEFVPNEDEDFQQEGSDAFAFQFPRALRSSSRTASRQRRQEARADWSQDALEFASFAKEQRTLVQPPDAVFEPASTNVSSSSSSSSGTIDLTDEASPEETPYSLKRFQRGALVTTVFGIGSVQAIYERKLTKAKSVTVKLPCNVCLGDDMTVIDAPPPCGLSEGDVIVSLKREDQDEKFFDFKRVSEILHAKEQGSNVEAEVLSGVPYEIYEVWLQWGVGGAVEKIKSTREKAQDWSWMPKAFLVREDLSDAQQEIALITEVETLQGKKQRIKFTKADIGRLWPGLYLNDAIIDYEIKRYAMQVPALSAERLFVFHSLFYNWYSERLQSVGAEIAYARVSNTTKKIDIFSKEILVIPINSHMHWTLAIICFPGLLGETVESLATAELADKVDEDEEIASEVKRRKTCEIHPVNELSRDENKDASHIGMEPLSSVSPPKLAAKATNDIGEARNGCFHAESIDVRKKIEDVNMNGFQDISSPRKKSARESVELEDAQTQDFTTQKDSARKRKSDETNSRRRQRAAIGLRRPFVVFFDSLCGSQTAKVNKILRQYLKSEWEAKRGPLSGSVDAAALPGFSPTAPEQLNSCDCGVYLLEFVHRILSESLDDFISLLGDPNLSLSQYRSKITSLTGKAWFSDTDIFDRRRKIAEDLITKMNMGNASVGISVGCGSGTPSTSPEGQFKSDKAP